MSSVLLWTPSVIPLLRVKRHMATICSDQDVESQAELQQLRQAGLTQLVNGAQEAWHQLLALFAGAVLFQQQEQSRCLKR